MDSIGKYSPSCTRAPNIVDDGPEAINRDDTLQTHRNEVLA